VASAPGYTALLPPQPDADIGRERILVRFDDGHTSLVFPGPDAVVEHPTGQAPRTKAAKS